MLWLTAFAALGLSAGRDSIAFDRVPETTRRAFVQRDFRDLLDRSPGVLIHLPGDGTGPRLPSGVAGATLRAFLRRTGDQTLLVQDARVVDEQFGYVELRRRYRRPRVAEESVQQILVSFRLIGGAWRVVEVLVLE